MGTKVKYSYAFIYIYYYTENDKQKIVISTMEGSSQYII